MLDFRVFVLMLTCLLCSVSHSEIRTSLVAQGLGFISPDYENTKNKNFAFIGATLRSRTDSKNEDAFKINTTALFSPGTNVLSYINLREIYFSSVTGSRSALHIGRKLHNWSSLDSIWNLGVYQPQFKWNPLTPENQGLTGIFWNKSEVGYGVTLFGSPLYIPDQGASYELKDGQFQASNPWFQTPPQNIRFQNQLLPIDYNVERPETSSVVFQTLLGAQLRLGEAKGYFAHFSAMTKPANQLALGYKGVLVTTRVRVDVIPKVYFENNYAADFGYRTDWGVAQISAIYNTPRSPSFDEGVNRPEFKSSLMWGPQILYRLRPFDFFLGYLDTSGGEITDVGPDVSADRKSLSERFLYKQAVLLQANYGEVFQKSLQYNASFQYKFSTKEGFREIRMKNKINMRGPWAYWLDLILIDTDSAKLSNMESFKSQDQVLLGVSYDL